MKRLIIPALVASNIALAGIVAHQVLADREPAAEIYADHIQQLRMDVEKGVLRVRLGKSSTTGGSSISDAQPSGTLALTPRAAIQLDVELRRTFDLIQRAAQKDSPVPQPVDPRALPDRPL